MLRYIGTFLTVLVGVLLLFSSAVYAAPTSYPTTKATKKAKSLMSLESTAVQTTSKPSTRKRPTSRVASKPRHLLELRRTFSSQWRLSKGFGFSAPPTPPKKHFQVVRFSSPVGKLVAYLTPKPKGHVKRPALLWAHGGYGRIGSSYWAKGSYVEAFRKAGFVVMIPAWRGESGNPGGFEMFYGEVKDAISAIGYLRKLPYVDPSRIYMAGHSTGGTLTVLTAMSTKWLRAAFSFGGNLDIKDGTGYGISGRFAPSRREGYFRSAIHHVAFLQSPVYYFEGEGEKEYTKVAKKVEKKARLLRKPFRTFVIKGGDHFNVVQPTVKVLVKHLLKDKGKSFRISLTHKDIQASFYKSRLWFLKRLQVLCFKKKRTHSCLELGDMYLQGKQTPKNTKKGLGILQKFCLQKVPKACLKIGDYWSKKGFTTKILRKAEFWYDKACSLRKGYACFEAGTSFEYRKLIPKACDYYLKACRLQHADGCHNLGFCYVEGSGRKKDVKRGLTLLVDGCRLKSKYSCVALGEWYYLGKHVKKDIKKSERYYKKACQLNNQNGCSMYALLLMNRDRSPKTLKRVQRMFEVACQNNVAVACRNVGVVMSIGLRKGTLPPAAFPFLKKGCRLGDLGSCHNIGTHYFYNRQIHPSYIKIAKKWFIKACNKKLMMSCNNLAVVYFLSGKVQKSLKLFQLACKNKISGACLLLGSFHESGKYLKKDCKASDAFYRKACKLGRWKACFRRCK